MRKLAPTICILIYSIPVYTYIDFRLLVHTLLRTLPTRIQYLYTVPFFFSLTVSTHFQSYLGQHSFSPYSIYLFIYLFLAVLGLRFCARGLSSCGERGPLFIVVRGPLTITASLVAEHRLQMRRLSSCGSRAQLLRGMWDLPRPGLEPVCPALAGRFSTTAPHTLH